LSFGLALFLLPQTAANSVKSLPASLAVLDKGVVVESIIKNSEADNAGLQAGDILLSWERGGKKAEIESPFDLLYIRLEEASRGPVNLQGLRGSQRRSWLIGSDTWGIWGRPNFSGSLLGIYREGQHLEQAGKLADAVQRWREGALLANGYRSSWLSPWFLSHAAQISLLKGYWDGYNDLYREAIRQANGTDPVVRAELLRQWASGFAYRGDLDNAEKYYEAALAEWRQLGVEGMIISAGLLDLGVVSWNRGDLTKAEDCFNQSLFIAKRLAPSSIQTVLAFANLGSVSEERGDLATAEEYFRQSMAKEQEYFPRGSHLAQTFTSLGALAHQRGSLARAETYYRKALAVAEKRSPANLEVADILGYLSECILDESHLEMAEKYERQAFQIRERLAPGSFAVALSLRNLGKIARIRGELSKAEDYYKQALRIGERLVPLPPETARFLVGLGYVARDRGDFTKAEEYYRRALMIMDKEAPGSLNYAETLADLAQATLREGQLETAEQLYRQALAALENKTAHLGGIEEDRSRYRGIHTGYYTEYVGLLLKQGRLELAFQTLEGSRARTLLESLSYDRIDIRAGVDAALLDREHTLQHLLISKSQYRIRLLNGKHTEGQLAAIDAELAEVFEQHRVVEAEIRLKSPKYAALTQPQPLSVKEVQDLLDPETTLLEYSLGEERSYVWVVGQESLAAYELPKRATIESLARRAYRLLTARNSQGPKGETETETEARWAKADADYFKTAANLSRIVLSPVAGLLQGKRLLIVSDGALQYIPFSALPTPDKPRMPLMLEHEVVNLPSASVVAELRRAALGRKEPLKAVAVIADPVFDSSDERLRKKIGVRISSRTEDQSAKLGSWSKDSLSAERLTRSVADIGLSRGGQFHLTRLLYSRQEAEAIMAVTPSGKGMKVLDFSANRAAATSHGLAQYRIVHFATHGLLDNKHPELSGLVFSMVNRQGKPQDGFLQLADIYNLNLPVELVVLSACETGLGEEVSGEGLIGLTRGFMYAGASRVVASLWNVSDVGTSELMARFYKAMEQDKLRPAAGLRAAQIQMWKQKQWRSPYYWAAFQLQGEWK
jgi:CHAT domain-containing protein/Tfp pilus assembly protein PilF